MSKLYKNFVLAASWILKRKERGGRTRQFDNISEEYYKEESYLNKKVKLTSIDTYAYFLLVPPAICFGLAAWQVRRRKWKESILRDLSLKTLLPAIELPENLADRAALEFQRIKVKGTFDHSKEMYLGPRTLIEPNAISKPNKSFLFTGGIWDDSKVGHNVGFLVVTPFQVSGRDVRILVNRGWVPSVFKDPETRKQGQTEGEVELEGILRLRENQPAGVIGTHVTKDRTLLYRDLLEMAELGDTSFIYLDAVKESTVDGGPIAGQTHIKIRNEHFSYILTWSFLGVVTSYMWYQKYIKKMW